jgi:hypothetical protein
MSLTLQRRPSVHFILIPLLAASTIAAADVGHGGQADPAAPQSEASTEFVPPEVDLSPAERVVLGLETKAAPDCGDTVTQAREHDGKPPLLEREPASPDKPHLIYAVDKRLDGCAVMVMKGDLTDMRPIPKAAEGPLLVIPASSGR